MAAVGTVALAAGALLLWAELRAPGPPSGVEGIVAIILLSGSPALVIVGLVFSRYASTQERIRNSGMPGEGRVVGMRETGMRINGNRVIALDLEIDVPGVTAQRGVAKERIPSEHSKRVVVGSVVPVRADRRPPHRMIVDWDRLLS